MCRCYQLQWQLSFWSHAVLQDALPWIEACLPHVPSDPEAIQSETPSLACHKAAASYHVVCRLTQMRQPGLLHVLGGKSVDSCHGMCRIRQTSLTIIENWSPWVSLHGPLS